MATFIGRGLAAALTLSLLGGTGAAEGPALWNFVKWEKEIAGIEKRLAAEPPKPGAVVFMGSSTIRLWDTAKAFPDLATANLGFGGSIVSDSTKYTPRLLAKVTKPKAVVVYAGDNDLALGRTPAQVNDDFAGLVKAIRAVHAGVPILFVSVRPSLARWGLYDKQAEANKLVKAACAAGEQLTYIDAVPAMLGADGKPIPELFVADKLHLNAAGYAVLKKPVAEALAPILAAK